MQKCILGLHHVTAIASEPQANLSFYAGILGLRLVKKTVNFDATDVYHLYYGTEKGLPGTIMTFFPYQGVPQGRKGKGQVTVTAFSVAEGSQEYWKKRFDAFHVVYRNLEKRFNEDVLYFEDTDGLGLELVFNTTDSRMGYTNPNIPLEYAIKGLYGITLMEECYEKTTLVLTEHLNHALIEEKRNRLRFSAQAETHGFVDVLWCPDALKGLNGAGTVHHVAFATPHAATQLNVREKLLHSGLNVTPILDREYFLSMYFREPGGVLFEVATLPPGFTVDEPLDRLGTSLKLPPWEEQHRQTIEQNLPPLH